MRFQIFLKLVMGVMHRLCGSTKMHVYTSGLERDIYAHNPLEGKLIEIEKAAKFQLTIT